MYVKLDKLHNLHPLPWGLSGNGIHRGIAIGCCDYFEQNAFLRSLSMSRGESKRAKGSGRLSSVFQNPPKSSFGVCEGYNTASGLSKETDSARPKDMEKRRMLARWDSYGDDKLSGEEVLDFLFKLDSTFQLR